MLKSNFASWPLYWEILQFSGLCGITEKKKFLNRGTAAFFCTYFCGDQVTITNSFLKFKIQLFSIQLQSSDIAFK